MKYYTKNMYYDAEAQLIAQLIDISNTDVLMELFQCSKKEKGLRMYLWLTAKSTQTKHLDIYHTFICTRDAVTHRHTI